MNLLYAIMLFAQGEAPPPAKQSTEPMGIGMIPILGAGLLMMFMMFTSSRKQKQAQVNLLANLKKNDKVETAAGIFGTIVAIKDNNEDEVTIRTDDTSNSRLRIRKSTIVRVFGGEEESKTEVKS